MEEVRRGPRIVTRRVGLINTIKNSRLIRSQIEMEILRAIMGFTFFTASGCSSVTTVFILIPHAPLNFMIHGQPV